MKKTLIVMCPTMLRAMIEWKEFLSNRPTIIKKANRSDLHIELLTGYKIYFRGKTEGKRALLGLRADIVSVDEFAADEFSEESRNEK